MNPADATDPSTEVPVIPKKKRKFFQSAALAVAFALSFRVGIAEAYEVEGPSMEPTVLQGDRVWVSKASYGLSLPGVTHSVVMWDSPDLGDVVIVRSPLDEKNLIKRIVGVAGDRIEVRRGLLIRNDVEQEARKLERCDATTSVYEDDTCFAYEETLNGLKYRISMGDDREGMFFGPVMVPEGHVFILGDHRDRSRDSRAFGPVPLTRLRGRALGIEN